MKRDSLMVLGAGMCQVPIIRRAQDMGFEVIAVSIGGDYPGFSIADRSYEIDVRDREGILAVARKCQCRRSLSTFCRNNLSPLCRNKMSPKCRFG